MTQRQHDGGCNRREHNTHYSRNDTRTITALQKVKIVTALLEGLYHSPIGMPDPIAYGLLHPLGVSLPLWKWLRHRLIETGAIVPIGGVLFLTPAGADVVKGMWEERN